MSRGDWTSSLTLAAYDDGHYEGIRDAAQYLMDRLRQGGCRDDDWNGGDVVEMVDAWLQAHGVDTHVYECGTCEDEAFGSEAELKAHLDREHRGVCANCTAPVHADVFGTVIDATGGDVCEDGEPHVLLQEVHVQ